MLSNLNGNVFWIFWFSIIAVGCNSALEKSIFRTRSILSLPMDVDCSCVLIDEWSFGWILWPSFSSILFVWDIWIDVFVQLKWNFFKLNYLKKCVIYLKLNDTFDSGRSVVANRDDIGGRSKFFLMN